MTNKNTRTSIKWLVTACLLFSSVVNCSTASSQDVSLSPANWPKGEKEKQLKLMQSIPTPNPLLTGTKGAVSGTYSAPAMRAGFEALQKGGTAVDAALTTANTQIVLAGGSWVSYSGILTMVYYDAKTGKVHNMNAGYNTVLDEKEPMSIPGNANLLNDPYGGTPSGRTALVPGYIAGVEAAHQKFGKLPFRCLFEPAIYFAENGFELTPYFAGFLRQRKDVLTRLPETKKIFCDKEGKLWQAGDSFKQKELAATLRKVSEQGADYIYRGPWTKKFVKAVQAEGGKISEADMNQYKVIWSEPVRGKYRDYEIVSHGLPANGGINTIEAMKLYELSGLAKNGHYSKDPESIFWLSQFHRVMSLGFLAPKMVETIGKGIDADLSPKSRTNPETTKKILAGMRNGKFYLSQKPKDIEKSGASTPKHSDAVVAVDQYGNVCAIVHSINAVMWGKTGIFVDGISINDSASFQQAQIALVKPGSRLPDPTNPTLVLNSDGQPILASSAMGSGLHQKTNQCLINVLEFGMNPKQADEAPYLMSPEYAGLTVTQRVVEGRFPKDVIAKAKSMGLSIKEQKSSRFAQGLWIGIKIDPQTGRLETASPAVTNGAAFTR